MCKCVYEFLYSNFDCWKETNNHNYTEAGLSIVFSILYRQHMVSGIRRGRIDSISHSFYAFIDKFGFLFNLISKKRLAVTSCRRKNGQQQRDCDFHDSLWVDSTYTQHGERQMTFEMDFCRLCNHPRANFLSGNFVISVLQRYINWSKVF